MKQLINFIIMLLKNIFLNNSSNKNINVIEYGEEPTLEPQYYKEGKKVDLVETIKKENIMKLEVLRFSSQKDSTLGALFNVTHGREFLCFTIEDEYRTEKKYGETRIPAGEYVLKLRTEGGFHNRYKEKFPEMHKGMLWLQNVPNFEYVLIHIGNNDDDTAGCLLVGNSSIQNITEEGMIGSSTSAYKRIYPDIAAAIENGDEVTINYIDYDSVD